jgi:hypothetical protein
MIFKRIASICFAIAFILAVAVFTTYFSGIISRGNARVGIIIFGGLALLMNLLSFRYDSKSDNNIIFWVGSVIIFVGLILKMQRNSINQVIIIIGMLIVALSYFYNPLKEESKNDDLLDN